MKAIFIILMLILSYSASSQWLTTKGKVIVNDQDNEVLLILGKGHEKVQEIENKLIPFDDTKIAIEAMELEN